MPGRVVAVSVAHVIDTPPLRHGGHLDAKPRRTGIDKRPVSGPVRIDALGLAGDSVLDTANHGGPTQAVYAYAEEDLDWWRSQTADEPGRPITPGGFGENLTVRGVDVNGARAGERWTIGTCVLEVTGPRVPCSTFAGFTDRPQWVRRFAQAGRPGAYLRVVRAGSVEAGDEITVVGGPGDVPTIREVFAAYYRR